MYNSLTQRVNTSGGPPDLNVTFSATKLQKTCEDNREAVREYGPLRAKLIRRRLDDLRAADSLEDMRALPQTRCHELKGNRAGQLSVDVGHPYRLLFEVTDDPVPLRLAGGLDWQSVRSVRIIGVEDTHE